MSKADELFDKADFNKYEYNGKIEYLSREKSHEIIFYLNTKLIESRCGIGSEYITMQEIKAINEKCKELRMDGGIEYGRKIKYDI